MSSIGIVSERFDGVNPSPTSFTQEIEELISEATQAFEKVTLIDPRRLRFYFLRGASPTVMLGAQDITHIDALVVRSTSGIERTTGLLARVLTANGTYLLDPLERFDGVRSGKLFSTCARHVAGTGSDSYLAFSRAAALELVADFERESRFPVLFKPVHGRQGVGIVRTANRSEAEVAVETWLSQRSDSEEAVLIQPDQEFTSEWRVLLLDGRQLGWVKKVPREHGVPANAAQGALFVSEMPPQTVLKLARLCPQRGFLGVDIGERPNGEPHVIEENYAPQWRAFQNATGVMVARSVVDHVTGAVAQAFQGRAG